MPPWPSRSISLTSSSVFLTEQAWAAPSRLACCHSVRAALESAEIPKVVHDAKAFLIDLHRFGVEPQNFSDDVMLYTFLLNADPGGVSPEALAERLLDRKLNAAAEQQAEATLAVAELLRPQIDAQEVHSVYSDIDLPLAPVLAKMEMTGIRVDTAVLAELSGRLRRAHRRHRAKGLRFRRPSHSTSILRSNSAKFCSKR